MPARRQRQQAEGPEEGPVWQPVHRFAFVQRLMRSGYLTHSTAIDIFEQLTGSDSGEHLAWLSRQGTHMLVLMCAAGSSPGSILCAQTSAQTMHT
jgi:hypothetical protein